MLPIGLGLLYEYWKKIGGLSNIVISLICNIIIIWPLFHIKVSCKNLMNFKRHEEAKEWAYRMPKDHTSEEEMSGSQRSDVLR